MRIHTNLSEETVRAAALRAGAQIERLTRHGSRSRAHTWDVILSGSSGRMAQGQTHQAATWDEWGIFLDVIFRRDPAAGCWAYDGADHFRWATGGRFDTLTPETQHKRHKWGRWDDVCTGAYAVAQCTCGAIVRRMVRGTFADLGTTDPTSAAPAAPVVATATRRQGKVTSVYDSGGRFAREYLATTSH